MDGYSGIGEAISTAFYVLVPLAIIGVLAILTGIGYGGWCLLCHLKWVG